MALLDWIVLGGTLLAIVVYGSWKTRGSHDIKGYLLGGKNEKWFTVGLSIMATQASAITFLSAPGQAYIDGMRFVQFYFGLPIAMVILAVVVVPNYHKMNIYTAYEFLEKRFDVSIRVLTAFLFLIQRGIAAGFTIFAPSLILSSLMSWNIYLTNLVIGVFVISYTVIGGTKAVNVTQKYQMAVIMGGMVLAGVMVVQLMPDTVSFMDAVNVAGKMERLNVIDFSFDLDNKYTVWTGLTGGLFLFLSYFGTDQSQVQRYLTARSVGESRLGLLFNGMAKIPMQFMILFIGAMVYVFYIFNQPPVFFNKVLLEDTAGSGYKNEISLLEEEFHKVSEAKKLKALALVDAFHSENESSINVAASELRVAEQSTKAVRDKVIKIIEDNKEGADTNDTNFIFLTFVKDYLPVGVVGLLIAAIFSASMSSTSSELNALTSTTAIDIYKRLIKNDGSDQHYLVVSKIITVFWGIFAIMIAMYANRLGTLIEAVNILGSLVYGTILGIFMVAFFSKSIRPKPIFIAAVISETVILFIHFHPFKNILPEGFYTTIPYLWYNVIGALIVVFVALILEKGKVFK